MKRRADVQDLSAMLLELRKCRATNVERAFKINIDDSAESVGRHFLRSTEKVTGCTVHNDIDLAKLFDSLCDGFFDLSRQPPVGCNSDCPPAILVDGVGGRLQMLHLAADERNSG